MAVAAALTYKQQRPRHCAQAHAASGSGPPHHGRLSFQRRSGSGSARRYEPRAAQASRKYAPAQRVCPRRHATGAPGRGVQGSGRRWGQWRCGGRKGGGEQSGGAERRRGDRTLGHRPPGTIVASGAICAIAHLRRLQHGGSSRRSSFSSPSAPSPPPPASRLPPATSRSAPCLRSSLQPPDRTCVAPDSRSLLLYRITSLISLSWSPSPLSVAFHFTGPSSTFALRVLSARFP